MTTRLAALPAYLLLCLLLGGSSSGGEAANLILQFGALAILLWSMITRHGVVLSRPARQAILLTSLVLILCLLQVIPLPPAIWTALPNREAVVEGFGLLGLPLAWMPLSLAPANTVAAVLWLLPAICLLVGTLMLGAYRKDLFAIAILAGMACSVFLGALQLAGGERSAAYLYQLTNRGIAVGLFANANHMATLLVISVPFAAALYRNSLGRATSAKKASMALVTTAALLVVLVGLAINGSLAGIGLAAPVIAASLLILFPEKLPRLSITAPLLAGLAVLSAVIMIAGPFGNNLFGAGVQNNADSRFTAFSKTIQAALDYGPVGSGLGSFVQVYRTYEDPASVVRFYMNNAHNDYLQLLLETGLPGLLLILASLFWLGIRAVAIWRESERDLPFEKAATIAVGAILAHSVVDYPLRTAAISAVFAVCIAMMANPRSIARKESGRTTQRRGVHLSA